MHPFDGLLSGCHVVDTVGFAYNAFSFFRWFTWLPLAPLLYQWYAVSACGVAGSNEEWLSFARDEDIIFFVYRNPVFGEDGNGAVISGFANNVIAWMTRYLPDFLIKALLGGKAKQFRNAD